jgi:hypothetical protein
MTRARSGIFDPMRLGGCYVYTEASPAVWILSPEFAGELLPCRESLFRRQQYQSSAYAFRVALQGDGAPSWTRVWSYIGLGKIFDVTSQRERASCRLFNSAAYACAQCHMQLASTASPRSANNSAHLNNIGHNTYPGCFRCHDGSHNTKDGKSMFVASENVRFS